MAPRFAPVRPAPWLLSALATGSAFGAELGMSIGADYSSGTYGTSQTTEITAVPLGMRWTWPRTSLRVSVPYLRITSSGQRSVVTSPDGGVIVANQRGGVQEGWGDVTTTLSYSAVSDATAGFFLDLAGKLKVATHPASRGLGTGEHDVALQADAFWVRGRWTPFATLGYRKYGQPAGLHLRSVPYAGLGFSHRLAATDSLGAMWDWRAANRDGAPPLSEATGFWMHRFDKSMRLQLYVSGGFTDASSDWGTGAMLRFDR